MFVRLKENTPAHYKEVWNLLHDFIYAFKCFEKSKEKPLGEIFLKSEFPRLEKTTRRGRAATHQLVRHVLLNTNDDKLWEKWCKLMKSKDMSTECNIIKNLIYKWGFTPCFSQAWLDFQNDIVFFEIVRPDLFKETDLKDFFVSIKDMKIWDMCKYFVFSDTEFEQKEEQEAKDSQEKYIEVVTDLIKQEKFSSQQLVKIFEDCFLG